MNEIGEGVFMIIQIINSFFFIKDFIYNLCNTIISTMGKFNKRLLTGGSVYGLAHFCYCYVEPHRLG